MNTQDTLKTSICDALAAFIRQRPGFDTANYGDAASYRADSRTASLQKRDAETLLAAVRWRESITGADILEAARGGRLSIEVNPPGTVGGIVSPIVRVDYCVGQYFPTEFRAGVCRVLSSALWNYTRENMPAPNGKNARWVGYGARATLVELELHDGLTAGDWLRAKFRREFGSSLARRWFN